MSGTNQLLINGDQQNGIGGGFMAPVGGGRWTGATYTIQEVNLKVGATFSNLSVVFVGGLSAGTAKFGINGSAGNQTVTGTATRATDTTHTDSPVATNLLAYIFTTGFDSYTTGSIQMNTAGAYTLQGSGNQSSSADYNLGTSLAYITAMGSGANEPSPDFTIQQFMEPAGTLSQLGVNVTTATTGTGTITANINGSSGNNTVTISSGFTGLVVDTTHTDSVGANSKLCHSAICTNASGALRTWTFSYVAASGAGMDATCSVAGIQSGATPIFLNFGGQLGNSIVQTSAQSYVPYGLTASKMRITQGSSNSASAVITFQNGGVNGNQTVTWSISGSGSVFDSTHTDTVAATNLIGAEISSGTVVISSMGVSLDDGSLNAVSNSFASIMG